MFNSLDGGTPALPLIMTSVSGVDDALEQPVRRLAEVCFAHLLVAGDQAFRPHAEGFPLLQGPGAHFVADGTGILGHPAFDEAFAKIAGGLLHEPAARPKQAMHGERLIDGLADHMVGLLMGPARFVEGRAHHGRQITVEILGRLGDHFRRIVIRGAALGEIQEQTALEGRPGFGEVLGCLPMVRLCHNGP